MSDPIDTAAERATAAIKALADAGHRAAHEHAHALDLLRAQVESLRAINAGLRERIEVLEHRVSHTAEVLAMPVDTEGPRDRNHEIVWGQFADRRAFCGVGGDIHSDKTATRSAIEISAGRWWLHRPLESNAFKDDATEAQAIRWVLDGVLP